MKKVIALTLLSISTLLTVGFAKQAETHPQKIVTVPITQVPLPAPTVELIISTTTTTKPFNLNDLAGAIKWITALTPETTTTTPTTQAKKYHGTYTKRLVAVSPPTAIIPTTGAIYVDTSSWSPEANCVMNHENSARVANRWYGSGINLRYDGRHSASGLFQIVRGTWAGYGGYTYAAEAPGIVQYERFQQLWAASPRHWHGTGCKGT